MSNDNLHNALRRLGSSYEPGPDFTAGIMIRVKRRARRQRIINIAMFIVCSLLIAGLSTYFIIPYISPIITMATAIPHTILLSICVMSTLLCLLLIADTFLRKKFMPPSHIID